jgi:hypothetical protein
VPLSREHDFFEFSARFGGTFGCNYILVVRHRHRGRYLV